MEKITLDSGVVLEIEMPTWERTRVVDALNRCEHVVVSSSGYWRASFDYRSDAIDFAGEGNKVLAPSGAILVIAAMARRN
jgi:hypothetical protein